MSDDRRFSIDLKSPYRGEALAALADPIRDAFVVRLMSIARAKWVRLAQERLQTTRRSYINGLSAVAMSPGVASVTLVGALPNRIEEGHPAEDLKKTLLGPNVPVVPARSGRRGKHALKNGGGFWRVIPFRHATPGTDGAVGPAMGSAYAQTLGEAKAEALGNHIYKMAKALRPSKTSAMSTDGSQRPTKVSWGGRLPSSNVGPKLKPHHTASIYAGMVKQSKDYARSTGSQYATFRVISTNSPGWQVAAKQGKHLVREVEAFVNTQAPASLAFVMSKAKVWAETD